MLSTNAFRYYKKNYDLFGQFDRGLPTIYYNLMSFLFLFIYITGISRLFKLIIVRQILSRKMEGEDIVSFVFSINNHTIHNALTKLGLTFPVYDFISQDSPRKKSNYFSTRLILFSSLANARSVYFELKNAKKDEVLYHNAIRVVKLSGLAFIYDHLLNGVKVVIQYNDHAPYCVLLHDMAEYRKIKTVYIQHAPVSERFPPLYHDLNILFSQDSVDKYHVINNSVKKFILFDVRLVLWNPVDDVSGESVLICPNKLDDLSIVKMLAKELNSIYKVIIRPHPADDRDWEDGKTYEVSKGRTIWDDIANAKYVLTNESAIILEAIHTDRLCYKCAFFSSSFDNYGFLRKGLLLWEYFTPAAVIKDISKEEITYNKHMFAYFVGEVNDKEKKIKLLKNEILHLRD